MKIKPTHPGETLLKEFLEPNGVTMYKLAKEIKVQQTRISKIVNGKQSITANTALKLSKFFGNSAEFWMGLQSGYDLAVELGKEER